MSLAVFSSNSATSFSISLSFITVSDGRFNLTIAKNRVSVSTADGISSLSGVKLIEFAKALPFLLELYVKKLKEIEKEVAELDEKAAKLIYGLEAVLKIV